MEELTMPMFRSVLGPYLTGFLRQRRALGYKYETEELLLLRFDRYCIEHNLKEPIVSREFLEEWCTQTDHEKIGNVMKRVTVVRNFLMYTIPLGLSVYIPPAVGKPAVVLPHLFTDEEIRDFFAAVDAYMPHPRQRASAHRMSNEYKILFRLYACCGMRNAEASLLPSKQYDLKNGIITILNAKGDKDRLVYVPDDLNQMCGEYFEALCSHLGFEPPFFFPGQDTQKGIPNTTVDELFATLWARTKYASCCNNKPTVHDFRFTFITKRLNLWAKQKLPVMQLLPYLSQYCGHKSVQETYYYYHVYKDMFDIIEEADKASATVIPEVRRYE